MQTKLYRQYIFKLCVPDDKDVINILDAQKNKTQTIKQALRVWFANKPVDVKNSEIKE